MAPMPKVWNEDSLACLWTRAKTERLVRAGQLTPCGTDGYGRRTFTEKDVMRFYAYARHQVDDPYGGLNVTKVFGGGWPGVYVSAADEDGSELDEDDGVSLADYHDRRLAALDAEQKVLGALDTQAEAFALGAQAFGLAVGRLGVQMAVGRWLGG
jgi:hypothetical protein